MDGKQGPHKGMKILIVDDEPRNLRILEEILDEQYLLSQATDGEQALRQVDAVRPDLILLDGMMPGKTGLEVCKQLRADEHHRHIKIIMISGKASRTDKKEGLGAGVDGYVVKPFEEEDLLAAIEQVML